jgi:GNAT superfamily N-acetyltransferase
MTSNSPEPSLFADLALARRLERTEGLSNAHFVEARAKLFPDSGARWVEVAGAYAMYDGTTSPLTQTFGLGLFAPLTSADMETIENFFRQREAPVFHEVSPLAEATVLGLLNDRGYHPMEFTSVMFRPLRRDVRLTAAGNERMLVRLARGDEHQLWAQTAAKGWSATGELADFMLTIGQISAQAKGSFSFLAELDGRPVATGGLILADGVALLAGASTVPEARNQGAQLALLDSRLRYAAEQGCDIAMMGAAPGSGSQRNAERHGFRIAYTRIKWRLGPAPRG